MSAENPRLDILGRQLARGDEYSQTQNLAVALRNEIVDLLAKEGHTHTFVVTRVMHIMMFPLYVFANMPEFFPLTKAHRRFLQYDQASYLCRTLQEDNRYEAVMVFADDGDPTRARALQIGGWNTTEYLHLDNRFEQVRPWILCTEDDPRFQTIDPYTNFHGHRFNGTISKAVSPADLLDLQDYRQLLARFNESAGNAKQEFELGLPLMKPFGGY